MVGIHSGARRSKGSASAEEDETLRFLPPTCTAPTAKQLAASPDAQLFKAIILNPYPVSTGIGPQSLPEWAFRGRPGLGGFAFALKLPELLSRNLPTVRAKLGQTSSFPNGPQIWFPIGL